MRMAALLLLLWTAPAAAQDPTDPVEIMEFDFFEYNQICRGGDVAVDDVAAACGARDYVLYAPLLQNRCLTSTSQAELAFGSCLEKGAYAPERPGFRVSE